MSQTITVMQADHVAALCATDRVFLCPALEATPPGHPDRLRAEVKCLIAGAILRGEAPGPYDDAEAELAAAELFDQRASRPTSQRETRARRLWRRR